MTEGRIQIHAGAVAVDDEDQITQRAARALHKIWAQADEAGWFDPTTR